MKTLFLTSTLPRFAGDMQANFVGEQAEAWQLARPNDDITILAPHHQGSARAEQVGGLRIERFRYLWPESWQRLAYPAILPNIRRNPLLMAQLPFFLLGQYWAARRLVRKLGIDVVYAHWVMPQGLVAWRLRQSLGVPYVLQNHSSDLSVYLKLGAPGRVLARSVLRGAAHFFCVNAAQRDFALSLLDARERSIFAERITVLPMGIADYPEATQRGGTGYDIATIARLSKKKGLNFLIEAAELLAQRGLRPSVGIAGDGEDRAELEALVREAHVAFIGFITGPDKDQFLAEAKRFAMPSRSYKGDVEGLPVALLEALCRGRPVLASRDTNIEMLAEWPEIRDAVVFIEDPADIPALAEALERLLAFDPEKSRAAAGTMSKYRWSRLIGQYLSKIDQILDV